MNKILSLSAILILIFTFNAFGQSKHRKVVSVLPEVNDEVLVAFRKKQTKTNITSRKRNSHDKYANHEVSYRTKSKRKRVRGITHDPEFENWANRKSKTRKIMRKNK
jgi:hypothetical protein